jgi:mRNA-degrading endonuclease RelE of RelBE toxin-antitoxin system
MQVFLSTRAKAALRFAPPASKKALRSALQRLERTGPRGLDIKELKQAEPAAPVFRLKVGTWRVAFIIRGKDIEVLHVFPRREGYGWMERL